MIDLVLCAGESGAERGIVGAEEESCSDAGGWVVMSHVTRLRWLGTRLLRGCCGVGFLESIRASNHDLELASILSGVCGGRSINTGALEGAFVVCDGSWLVPFSEGFREGSRSTKILKPVQRVVLSQ
jgi:hypothetical protein